jgi:DnaJ-class molecular chaperone
MKSAYEILGVPDGSDIGVCKKAYRKLCVKYHPDNCNGDDSKFLEVKTAWENIQRGTAYVGKFKEVTLTHETFTKVVAV